MRTLSQRLASLFRRNKLDRELTDEIEIHVAMQAEEFVERGMDASSARRAAQREFGSIAQIEETYRERRGIPWLETAARDFSYAWRGLRRSPGFTAAAVALARLGIGANTAIFSMFHALMLRMLPVANPEELVTLYRTGGWGQGFSSYPLYLDIQKRADLFSEYWRAVTWTGCGFARAGRPPETAHREFVSGNYFASPGRLSSDRADLLL